MFRTLSQYVHVAVFIAVFSLGCQGNPTVPAASPEGPVCGKPIQSSSHQCLGYYMLMIDTDTLKVDPIPVRTAEWHFNLTGILNTTMGVSAVGVPSEADPANGLFVFDITLTHPFETKPQLAGFDVKGILMVPGTYAVGSLIFAGMDETRLENADGYTRWWNPTEFTSPGMFGYTQGNLALGPMSSLTATINPYKQFADCLNLTQGTSWLSLTPLDDDQGRGVFTAGSENVRRYYIRFPMDPGPLVVYGYAIDASWAVPVPNPPGEIPDDFPMEANQPEAFFVSFEPVANTLFHDSESGKSGGVLRFWADIRDWQGMYAGNTADEVDIVRFFSPDLWTGGVTADLIHNSATKAMYEADLTGIAEPLVAGEFPVIMRVGSSDGSTYDQGFGPAPDADLSAFKILTVDVIDPECEADSNNSHLDAEEIWVNDDVSGYLCGGTDDEDWYFLDIWSGWKAEGELRFFCDADSCGVIVHDVNGLVLDGASCVDGLATVNLTDLDLYVGKYYINVFTSSFDQAVTYFLEIEGENVDIKPTSPVDVTPDGLILDPIWLEKRGNNLYLGGYTGFWVYDVSYPENPQLLSRTKDFTTTWPAFNYPYLYYCESIGAIPAGIDVIDYTDPANPVHYEDVLEIPYETHYITLNSEYLFLAANDGVGGGIIYIYDIATDPYNPQYVNEFVVDENVIRLGLLDPEGPETVLVMLTNTYMGLFDVEDPMSVSTVAASLLIDSTHQDLSIGDDYFYTTTIDTFDNGWLNIKSYSSGPGLVNESSTYTSSRARYVDTAGDYAYIGGGSLGLHVMDISNPSLPSWKGYLPTVSDSHYVCADGDVLINIPEGAGYVWYDLTDPEIPNEIFRPMVLNQPFGVTILGDHAYFTEGYLSYTALKVLNVADPGHAYVEGEYLLDDVLFPIAGRGEIIVVAGTDSDTVWIFNVADPENPDLVTLESYSTSIIGLGVTDEAIYISLLDGTIDIYDTTSWPVVVAKTPVSLPDKLGNPVFRGDWMYGNSTTDVHYVDISSPNSPAYVGSYTPGYDPIDLVIQGNTLYILTTDTLEVTDISAGGLPVYTADVVLPYNPPADVLAIEGQYAYADIDHWQPVTAVNLWPPDSPSVFGDIYPVEDAWEVIQLAVDNGYLYETLYYKGVRIFDLY